MKRENLPIVEVIDDRSGLRQALELLLLGRADVRLAHDLSTGARPAVVVVSGMSEEASRLDGTAIGPAPVVVFAPESAFVPEEILEGAHVVGGDGPEVLDDLTEVVSALLPRTTTTTGHTTAA